MPKDILNPTLYADRTVQDWHRESFPPDYWAIDLDLMGACNRCRQPLYLIESTTNPNKPFTILENLAERANVPAVVVLHNTNEVIGAWVLKHRVVLEGVAVVGDYLRELRHFHLNHRCGKNNVVNMRRGLR